MQYGGMFLAVSGISAVGGNDFGGKRYHGNYKHGIFSAGLQHGGNCLAVGGFSFLWRYVFGSRW